MIEFEIFNAIKQIKVHEGQGKLVLIIPHKCLSINEASNLHQLRPAIFDPTRLHCHAFKH